MNWPCIPLATYILLLSPSSGIAQSVGDTVAGRAVYMRNCKLCHGLTGQGTPAMVKSSKGALQDLSSKDVQRRTDAQLAQDIAGGTPQKKPIKPLPAKEMKDVIAFVRTLAAK